MNHFYHTFSFILLEYVLQLRICLDFIMEKIYIGKYQLLKHWSRKIWLLSESLLKNLIIFISLEENQAGREWEWFKNLSNKEQELISFKQESLTKTNSLFIICHRLKALSHALSSAHIYRSYIITIWIHKFWQNSKPTEVVSLSPYKR